MNNRRKETRDRRRIYVLIGVVGFIVLLLTGNIDPSNPAVGRTMAVAALMAFFWLTEALPLAVTALFPVALFPLLGIMGGREVAGQYLNNILFLFIGGFIIALAMERWNLHRRIALKVILTLGNSPGRLLLGFMLASWALSMWISNTATTMMMVPIVVALLMKIEEAVGQPLRRLEVALLIGIAYASSIGGMATLVGTAPNLSLARIYSMSFPNAPEITFVYWLQFGLPISMVMFTATYGLLRARLMRGISFDIDPSLLRKEYQALGTTSFEEKVIMTTFFSFALLLVTRADIAFGDTVIHGWASRFGAPAFIDDGTVAIMVALVLFFMPSRQRPNEFIMDRGTIRALPWDIIVLLGGGFALARGFQESGLSAFLGGQLEVLSGLPTIFLVLAVTTLVTFLTELTSNTATTQVLLPIIVALSAAVGVPPLMLMVPAAIAASCAFMLPVATPPNAIVFGTHRLRISDMARIGIWLNLISIILVTLMTYAIGRLVF